MKSLVALIVLSIIFTTLIYGQHVFIVVIDGVRYSETFGSEGQYIPYMWNTLRPQGSIYTSFRNDGYTATISGHTAIMTGTWEKLINDGSERPASPTLFEYLRKQKALPEASCFLVSRKSKLDALTHSTHREYGSTYKASFTYGRHSDLQTWKKLVEAMNEHHPRLVMVTFAETDLNGHAGQWKDYLSALRQADSLVNLLWEKIQTDSVYKNSTTMFVTTDHGRHDDEHGGFQNHGDSCEGCRHIWLLAIGPDIKPNTRVSKTTYQVDLTPTIGQILGLKLPTLLGRSLIYVKK
ncbi:MAG: alkaline phosphatase family protein [Ignavibacteriae bacterium]|nr:alkaline phosphatase family protein [Ignavibacteriota bacterium]